MVRKPKPSKVLRSDHILVLQAWVRNPTLTISSTGNEKVFLDSVHMSQFTDIKYSFRSEPDVNSTLETTVVHKKGIIVNLHEEIICID